MLGNMRANLRDRVIALYRSVVLERLTRIARSELASRLATGAFWSLAGGASSQLFAFLASIWVARKLGGELYGEFAMIRSTAMMFSLLAAVGIGIAATKHVAEYSRVAPVRAGRIVVLSIAVAVFSGGAMATLLYLIASPLAHYALHAPHLESLLRIGALLLILNTIIFSQTGVLAGFEAFREMTRVGVVAGAVSLLALVAGTSIAGLQGALWGAAAGMATHCILNQMAVSHEAVKHGILLSFDSCMREWRTLGAFSLPVGLSNLVKAPVTWACHTLLVNQYGGYPQMGIFNAANQWGMAILFIPERVCMLTLPILSSLNAEGELTRFRKTLRLCILLNLGASTLLALPVILFSRWIMRAYGSDFVGGDVALSFLAASAIFVSVSIVGERALASLGKVWLRLFSHIFWSAVLLGCAYSFVANDGGAADLSRAIFIASGMHTVVVMLILKHTLRSGTGFRDYRDDTPQAAGKAHDEQCVS